MLGWGLLQTGVAVLGTQMDPGPLPFSTLSFSSSRTKLGLDLTRSWQTGHSVPQPRFGLLFSFSLIVSLLSVSCHPWLHYEFPVSLDTEDCLEQWFSKCRSQPLWGTIILSHGTPKMTGKHRYYIKIHNNVRITVIISSK